MKRKFEFEFEDQSPKTISFEYCEALEEKMSVVVESGVPVIYANRSALLFLAKTLAKMGMCEYEDGFHIHLNTDFDSDKPEALRVVIVK